jgi:hypothetical protein
LRFPHRFCCAPTSRLNNCWLCRFMALSWRNLPYAQRTLRRRITIENRSYPRQRAGRAIILYRRG